MKLQKLFVATAILASTATGVTAFAAETLDKDTTNTIGFEKGEKTITATPNFVAENQTLKAGDYNFALTPENEGENLVTFEDFTGDKDFKLKAMQTTAFENKAVSGKTIAATLKYGQVDLAAKTTKETMTVTPMKDFAKDVAQTVVSDGDFKAFGKWELAISNVTTDVKGDQMIPAGAYVTTVNWDIANEAPATVK